MTPVAESVVMTGVGEVPERSETVVRAVKLAPLGKRMVAVCGLLPASRFLENRIRIL
jgi:hypothetical protein